MVDRLDKNIDLLRNDMRAGFASMDDRFTAMGDRMVDGFTSLRRDMLATVLTITGALVATMAAIVATAL